VRVAVVFGAAVWPDGVPSPALRRRTAHAAGLWHAGEVDLILVSGGLGAHPPPEAVVMAAILSETGVPPAAVALDPDARTTMATAAFVARWRPRRAPNSDVVAVTDRYHAPRARLALWAHGVTAGASWPAKGTVATPRRLRTWCREAIGLPVYAVRGGWLRLTARAAARRRNQ